MQIRRWWCEVWSGKCLYLVTGDTGQPEPSPVLLRRLSSLVRAAQQHFNPS